MKRIIIRPARIGKSTESAVYHVKKSANNIEAASSADDAQVEEEEIKQKKKKYKQKYKKEWEAGIKWLLPVHNNPFKAYCKFCRQILSCSGGFKDLQKHSTVAKHIFYTENPGGIDVKEETDDLPVDSMFESQIEDICRICLQRNEEMHSIFDVDESGMSFAEKIMQASTLVIERETDLSLPTQICLKCVSDLEVAFQFRMTCESSDTVLQMYAPPRPIITMAMDDETQEQDQSQIVIEKHETEAPVYMEIPISQLAEDVIIDNAEFENEEHLWEEQVKDEEEILLDVPPDSPQSQEIQPPVRSIKKESNTVQVRLPFIRAKKTFICDHCGRQFKNKTELSAHVRRHLGEKPYACDQCDKRFTVRAGLRVHRRIHTGERPYACRYCPSKFADVSCRIVHERIHTGEKRNVCNVCGIAFTHKHSMRRHSLIHTGEKKYHCSYCDKKFASSSNLRQHENVHFREMGLPYKKYCRRNNRFTKLAGTVSAMQLDSQKYENMTIDHSNYLHSDEAKEVEEEEILSGSDDEEAMLAVNTLTKEVSKHVVRIKR